MFKALAQSMVLLGLAAVAPVLRAQDDIALIMCSSAISDAVQAALRYGLTMASADNGSGRFDPRSPAMPDYGILLDGTTIYVRNLVDEPGCVFEESILPQSESASFVLVNDAELERLANLRGEALPYVHVQSVRTGNQHGDVRFGAALALPQGEPRGITCCCGGTMFLRIEMSTWIFEEWQDVICA